MELVIDGDVKAVAELMQSQDSSLEATISGRGAPQMARLLS